MRQKRQARPVFGSVAGSVRRAGAGAAVTAIAVAVVCVAAACSSSGTSSGTSPGTSPAAPATASTPAAAPSGTGTAAAATAFVPIVEPFDPGHPARAKNAPATCNETTTLGIEQCYEAKTENTDAEIDAAASASYASASAAQRATILAQDSAWLQARGPVCEKAFQSGGTIDGVNVAACLLDESTARLDAVKGITPPEATLKATDNTNPAALSWYTTAEGSRIAMVDTQGDGSGGVIIAWVIIGGADGFVVNPSQFYYSDGSFTDKGVVQPPNPAFHRVATGVQYQFDIDYSHLSSDPNASKGAGGYVYAPGTPVAIWK
jgi:uncharacterized protein YecT (DUF1311 family)